MNTDSVFLKDLNKPVWEETQVHNQKGGGHWSFDFSDQVSKWKSVNVVHFAEEEVYKEPSKEMRKKQEHLPVN